MDDISLVFGGIQTAAIVGGIVLALMELRHLKEQRKTELDTRQAQLFMQIYEPFHSREFQLARVECNRRMTWKDYDDYTQKYDALTNPEAAASIAMVGLYFEGIGTLVKKGLLDMSFVDELLSRQLRVFWEKFGPMFQIYRSRKDPDMYRSLEYLYDEEIKYREKHGLTQT